MKNLYLKKIITVISCAILSALFIVTMFFASPKTPAVPETTGEFSYYGKITKPDGTYEWGTKTLEMGKDFSTVRITELSDLGKLTKVNYVADKFVQPGSLSEEYTIVDLTKPFDFAEKGTLMFAVMNLDPWAEDFDEQAEALSKYKKGEYWCFTVKLPQIFSASNVYSNAQLAVCNGEIENYNFAEFNTNYVNKTEHFSAETEPNYIDLRFYTKREAISNAFITVHYQSAGSAYSGIKGAPLIGTEKAVKDVNESSKNLLISVAILSAVVFAVLIVLSVIERKKDFVSAIVWVFGIAVLLLSRFMLTQATGVPLLWIAVWLASSFIILGGALLSMGVNLGKVPAKFICPALSAVGALFAFICPFIPFGAAYAMQIACKVIKGVCAAMLLGYIGLALFNKEDKHGILPTVCAGIIAVAVVASIFMPQVFPTKMNPIFWLCTAVTVTTFISLFMVITEMKKSNDYLTNNLQREVERQVKDIRAVISDRDKLLQFVSHDMKKPLQSAVSLCETTIGREKDEEQIKAMRIIKKDAERIINNLSEIARYAKLNYLAEPSQVADISELCAILCKDHEFNCDANGIVLKNEVQNCVKAFVKKKGLENVVSNIIFNALEHAKCKTITLSVKSDKNKVILCVADDGKGIDENLDVFAPYISENDSETGGLGLYICKNIIESMNGELTFETGDNGTTFYISLLKA